MRPQRLLKNAMMLFCCTPLSKEKCNKRSCLLKACLHRQLSLFLFGHASTGGFCVSVGRLNVACSCHPKSLFICCATFLGLAWDTSHIITKNPWKIFSSRCEHQKWENGLQSMNNVPCVWTIKIKNLLVLLARLQGLIQKIVCQAFKCPLALAINPNQTVDCWFHPSLGCFANHFVQITKKRRNENHHDLKVHFTELSKAITNSHNEVQWCCWIPLHCVQQNLTKLIGNISVHLGFLCNSIWLIRCDSQQNNGQFCLMSFSARSNKPEWKAGHHCEHAANSTAKQSGTEIWSSPQTCCQQHCQKVSLQATLVGSSSSSPYAKTVHSTSSPTFFLMNSLCASLKIALQSSEMLSNENSAGLWKFI